jgi:hypothetical protein
MMVCRNLNFRTPYELIHILASLPAGFIVWAASNNANFARGKMIWSNWDVAELKAKENEIASSHLLSTSVEGWAAYMPDMNSEVYKKVVESFSTSPETVSS